MQHFHNGRGRDRGRVLGELMPKAASPSQSPETSTDPDDSGGAIPTLVVACPEAMTAPPLEFAEVEKLPTDRDDSEALGEAARLGRGTSEPAVRGGTSVGTANVDTQVSEVAAEACPERNSAISDPSHSPETVASLDNPRGPNATLVVARTCPEVLGEVGAPAPEDLLVVSNLYGQRRCFKRAMWKDNAEFAKLTFERLIEELVTHFGSMQPSGYETFMKGLGLLVLPGIKTLLNILFQGKVAAFEKKLHEAIDNPEEPFQPLHSSGPQPFNPSS